MKSKSERKKKWAPKVRTGCLTCRCRRIKCDENKPSCDRCISTGRKCDGYEDVVEDSWSVVQNRVFSTTLSQPSSSMTPFTHIPALGEMRMFHILCQRIVPRISGLFDRDFWNIVILQASQVYPAVWHAALAVAAAQQLRYSSPSSTSLENTYKFALEQCNKSIRHLVQVQMQTNTATPSPSNQEMLLIACLLLTRYCSLQGHHTEALVHIQNGQYLLKQWKYGMRDCNLHSTKRLPNCVAPTAAIFQHFMRLENQTFSSPYRYPDRPPMIVCEFTPLLEEKESFPSANFAYTEILAILNKYKRTIGACLGEFELRNALTIQSHQFMVWKSRFVGYQHKTMTQNQEEEEKTEPRGNSSVQLSILRIWEICGDIVFAIDPSKDELTWDDFTIQFASILEISRILLRRDPSLIALLGEKLQMVSNRCRDQRIQQSSIQLLAEYPYQDGIFDTTIAARVCATKAKLEASGRHISPLEHGFHCYCSPKFICNEHRVSSLTIQPTIDSKLDHIIMNMKTVYDIKTGGSGTLVSIPLPLSEREKGDN